jgi:hypothetical protein
MNYKEAKDTLAEFQSPIYKNIAMPNDALKALETACQALRDCLSLGITDEGSLETASCSTKAGACRAISGIPNGEHLAMALWNREDVKLVVEDHGMDIKLTDKEMDAVLDYVDKNHDPTCGISWITLADAINEVVRKQRKGGQNES